MEAINSWSWEKVEWQVVDCFLGCYFSYSSSDSETLVKDMSGKNNFPCDDHRLASFKPCNPQTDSGGGDGTCNTVVMSKSFLFLK